MQLSWSNLFFSTHGFCTIQQRLLSSASALLSSLLHCEYKLLHKVIMSLVVGIGVWLCFEFPSQFPSFFHLGTDLSFLFRESSVIGFFLGGLNRNTPIKCPTVYSVCSLCELA